MGGVRLSGRAPPGPGDAGVSRDAVAGSASDQGAAEAPSEIENPERLNFRLVDVRARMRHRTPVRISHAEASTSSGARRRTTVFAQRSRAHPPAVSPGGRRGVRGCVATLLGLAWQPRIHLDIAGEPDGTDMTWYSCSGSGRSQGCGTVASVAVAVRCVGWAGQVQAWQRLGVRGAVMLLRSSHDFYWVAARGKTVTAERRSGRWGCMQVWQVQVRCWDGEGETEGQNQGEGGSGQAGAQPGRGA